MPQLGETVAEGKIVKWFKSAGDAVKPGDNLFEIETDKTSMEVPATSAGTLSEIRFQVGEVAKVGAVVAVISGAGLPASAPAAATKPAAAPERAAAPVAISQATPVPRTIPLDPFREVRTPERNFGPAKLPGGAFTTPLARRLASERGIDLSRVTGSGPHGRIVASDVEKAAPAAQAMATGASAAQVKALYAGIAYEEAPLDSMRRTIAKRLVEAKQTVPHFYLTTDMDAGRLIAMREEANAAAPQDKDGQPAFKLSLNDFIIKTWAAALQRIPAANAVWAEDRILRFMHSDIGVAVAIEGGLITPVIRNAETKSLTAISAEMRDLAARACAQAHAERIPGRRQRDFKLGHVRRARVLRHHQSAACHHPGGGRHAARAGRGRGRRRQIHQPADDHAVLRSSRGGRRARRRAARRLQEFRRKAGHRFGVTGEQLWLAKSRMCC
jgi:pyruvate dehydrogenase E2 component (dihydrolipoamide acetyltransferase)